jgi:hypothetical protein
LAFLQHLPAGSFLLDKNFSPHFPERFVIRAQLFLHGDPARFGFLSRACGTLVAFGENALHWPKETPAQKKVEKENENDGRHSRQEQIAELV